MCGGGGVQDNSAEIRAREDARVADAINKINNIFGISDAVSASRLYALPVATPDSIPLHSSRVVNPAITEPVLADMSGASANAKAREDLYTTMKNDATTKAMQDLNQERGIAQREANFKLARQGLAGGSADIDLHQQIGDQYQKGILSAGNAGDTVANNARANDEKTRVNLINAIRSGLDGGTAQQMAYQGLSNNAAQASNDAANATLAGFFSPLMQTLKMANYQDGFDKYNQKYKLSSTAGSPMASFGGKIRGDS